MIIGISGKKQNGKNTVSEMIQYFIDTDQNKCNPLHIKNKYKIYSYEHYLEYKNLLHLDNLDHIKIISFAQPLKEIAAQLMQCSAKDFESALFKDSPIQNEFLRDKIKEYLKRDDFHITYRDVLIYTASILKNAYGENIFIDILRSKYNRTKQYVNIVEGDYVKKCIRCGKTFQGHKFKYICPNCVDFRNKHDNTYWIISDVRHLNEATFIKEEKGLLIRVDRGINDSDNDISETALDNYSYFDSIIHNTGNMESLFLTVRHTLLSYNIIQNV